MNDMFIQYLTIGAALIMMFFLNLRIHNYKVVGALEKPSSTLNGSHRSPKHRPFKMY